jgi:hypothetical protein
MGVSVRFGDCKASRQFTRSHHSRRRSNTAVFGRWYVHTEISLTVGVGGGNMRLYQGNTMNAHIERKMAGACRKHESSLETPPAAQTNT